MGVFDQIKSGSSSPSPGGVFGQIKQVEDVHNVASFKQGTQQFGAPFQDPSQSQFIQHVNQSNIDNPTPPHDSTRDIPILGSVFKALDAFGKTPVQHVIADVGQMLYTPGAGLANVASFTGAAEQGISKLFGAAESTGAKIAQRAGAEAITGAPLGVGQYQAQGGDNLGEAAKQGVFGALLGGAGGAAGSAIGKYVERFAQRAPTIAPEAEQATRQTFSNYSKPLTNPQPLDSVMQDIHQEVNQRITPPLENPKLLDQYLQLHLGEDVPKSEINGLSYNDKADLAKHIQDNLSVHDMASQVAKEKGYDWNQLSGQVDNTKPIIPEPSMANEIKPSEINAQPTTGTPQVIRLSDLRNQSTTEASTFKTSKGSTYTVGENGSTQRDKSLHVGHETTDVGLKRPSEQTVYVDKSEASRVGSHGALNKDSKSRIVIRDDGLHLVTWNDAENRWGRIGPKIEYTTKPEVGKSPIEFYKTQNEEGLGKVSTSYHAGNDITEIGNAKPKMTTVLPDQKIKGQQLRDLKTGDETKFAQTVQQSEHTAPELTQRLSEQPVVGARTTDVLNRQQATKLIEQHGNEGLYSKLMSKTKQFSASETTAAQILAKQYSSMGGEANLSKAIDLVSKTAKGGREMGQAIQSLSQWNKLDQSGALLLGERQLNRGITDTSEWKKLSTAQAAPIQEAAQRAEVATATKSLADEVLHIVTNKQAGEALTEAEKATIKQFNDQVKDINSKTKPFLPQEKGVKANSTIKEVSQIEPKARTRDQVVSFLDAKAEQARKRLEASRQMGFAAVNKGNPVIDYAIIGASHIAKGIVKLSDFSEAMVRDFGDSVKPHINEAFTMATNIFRKENGLPTIEALDRVVNKAVKDARFTPEDAANFKAWASEIGHYADHNLKVEATQDLQAAMKYLGDSTLGQKIATVQTGSMLLNSVTMERNVLGNAAQMISDKAIKVVTVPIDWGLSKLTGEQRTIVFKAMNQEKFWKNFMIGTKSGWKGVSPNGQLDSYGVHPNVFGKNNPLKYITKLLGASLQGFDHAFYTQAKGEVLATYAEQLGKAQGLSHAEIKSSMKDLIVQLDDRIHELADHAGKYATYQDDTMLSKGAEMLRKGLNEATTGAISKALVEKGMSPKYSLEGFGAGDVLLKFAKTPANLVMRGIDYSPIGFIRSIMDIGTFVFNREKFNQHEAVRSLGRAITGTLGFTGMGYILADAGILTGSASMDKDVRSIQEQSGQGAYKVNWSALSRFFKSGFSYDAAAYQKGDHLMDYQWLQPAAISVAMGVNANKAVKAHKAGDTTAGWQMAGKALLGGIQTVLENPMVQGLSSVIDAGSDIIKKQDPTKLINIAKGVPASFVPTLSNQARQATDNNQRETFDKSLLTEIGNMMANKVPGLSKNLPISYDSLGNAREKIQGGQSDTVTQYLTSFFSPAKMTEYQVSPEAKMVLDLMNQSGDASLLPRIADKSFHVIQGKQLKDLKVSLTKEQFSRLQQETGKMVTEKLSQKADLLANPNVALQHKVDAVKKILSDVGKKAKQDIGQQMGYQKSKVKS